MDVSKLLCTVYEDILTHPKSLFIHTSLIPCHHISKTSCTPVKPVFFWGNVMQYVHTEVKETAGWGSSSISPYDRISGSCSWEAVMVCSLIWRARQLLAALALPSPGCSGNTASQPLRLRHLCHRHTHAQTHSACITVLIHSYRL